MPGLYPKEYAPEVMLERGMSSKDEPSNAAKTTLDSLHLLIGQTFEYLFDFGDSALHEIKVVAKQSLNQENRLQTSMGSRHLGLHP